MTTESPVPTSAVDSLLLPINGKLLTVLPFIQRTYGRLVVQTVKGTNNAKPTDTPRRLPMAWDAGGQALMPVMPDQDAGGLLFWITTGPARPRDWQAGVNSYYSDYPVALMLWWNPELTQTGQWQTGEVLRQTLLALANFYPFTVTTVQDQLARSVFAGLDYDFDNHPFMLYPYQGIRIEGTLTVRESLCQ